SWLAQILPYVEQDNLAKTVDAANSGIPGPVPNTYPTYPPANPWYPWGKLPDNVTPRFQALMTPLSVYKCTADSRQELFAQVEESPGSGTYIKVAFTGYVAVSGPDYFAWSKTPQYSFYGRQTPGILVATNRYDPSIGNREVPVSNRGIT